MFINTIIHIIYIIHLCIHSKYIAVLCFVALAVVPDVIGPMMSYDSVMWSSWSRWSSRVTHTSNTAGNTSSVVARKIGQLLILVFLPDKFARFQYAFHAFRFESLDLPPLPADRSDFDVLRALKDEQVPYIKHVTQLFMYKGYSIVCWFLLFVAYWCIILKKHINAFSFCWL